MLGIRHVRVKQNDIRQSIIAAVKEGSRHAQYFCQGLSKLHGWLMDAALISADACATRRFIKPGISTTITVITVDWIE
jgi:hypothetical protein